jgi:hypothetical protein
MNCGVVASLPCSQDVCFRLKREGMRLQHSTVLQLLHPGFYYGTQLVQVLVCSPLTKNFEGHAVSVHIQKCLRIAILSSRAIL